VNWIIIAFVVFFVASLLYAYNFGWQTGHDVHHDDDMPRHTKGTTPKPPDRSLYV
jgi:hypothetical protein